VVTLIHLDGWAEHIAIGAENAAIARFGLEQGMADPALIKPLAGVREHCFLLPVSAFGAGDGGCGDDVRHALIPRSRKALSHLW